MLRWVKASKLNVLNAILQLMRKVARVRGCLIWYSKDSLPIVQMYSNEIKRVTKKWLNVIKKAELLDKRIVPFSFFFYFPFFFYFSFFSLFFPSLLEHLERKYPKQSRKLATGSVWVNRIPIKAFKTRGRIFEIQVPWFNFVTQFVSAAS